MFIATHHDNSHWAKLANYGTMGIWIGFTKGHPVVTYHTFHQNEKNSLTNNVTFLDKLIYVLNNFEKLTVAFMSYEGSDDEEDVKMVLAFNENNNNNYNVVRDLQSNDKLNDFLRSKLRTRLK